MEQRRILLCAGTGCISSGALKARDALLDELNKRGIADQFEIVSSGCHGFCEQGPLFVIHPEDIFYCRVQAEDIPELVEEYLINGRVVDRLLYMDPITNEHIKNHMEIGFYAKQNRRVLHNCGVIDPENIDEYLGSEGYVGLKNALHMEQVAIIDEMKKSGLRGRGGAGFPTGMKWDFTYKAKGKKKYIVCNADEGDPGAFMDRSVLEGDPHAVIEGMAIAAYAIGADEGYVYVRAEYPLAIKRLRLAITAANERGFLGNNILGTTFNFNLKIKEGAGAFVCGEETALLASIEGERGMPRPRPPFPANSGLWGKPTCLNNVETFANVPLIYRIGAEEYGKVGTERSKGTKVFALTGKINNTGLAEVPMGIPMREIIFDIGGGVQHGKKFKAVQIGGPSGGCLPEEQLDLPVDYDSLTAAGAMMGSGGLVVMDEDTCMVDLARYFLTFTQSESCGKCTPCREGTKRMLEILERITQGQGEPADIDALEELAESIKDSSLCGLGQTAPNPVLSTLRYFRHEYEEHIVEGKCRAGACSNLVTYHIDSENCIGCTVCAKNCPVNAITGERKQPHEIDQAACIKCGVCFEKCKFDAVKLK
ncbi:MAG: NADH-quinone oxidoreductase subunit NuoF [Firmicutes bacterium]|nr:NADH-quinone oxidoreductase subunit NuoF [Bacillota bacterium]